MTVTGPRKTKHDYAKPGSFARVTEAALALADVDAEDDAAYERARKRLEEAIRDWRARTFAAAGGRASGKALSPEQRSQKARQAGISRACLLTGEQASGIARLGGLARWRKKSERP